MVDITHKVTTLREATAEAIVRTGSQTTIDVLKNGKVPKGNVFEMAKAAGFLAVKKTSDLIPDCHPLPIEFAGVDYEVNGLEIIISMTVRTVYKTGVEVEAMHGASVVALTIYDMLKPIDKDVEIGTIRLKSKKGGKSSFKVDTEGLKAQVVVCSDTIFKAKAGDKTGETIVDKLKGWGLETTRTVIPDDPIEILGILEATTSQLIVFTGGTGVGPRDFTPQTIEPLLDATLKGVEEQMRRYGQDRTPYAMFSRSVVGIKDGKLVLALPGSARGALESMEAVFPHLLHVFKVMEGKRHD